MEKRHNEKQINIRLIFILFVIVLICSVFVSFMLGRYPINPKELLKTILYDGLGIGEQIDKNMSTVLYKVRLPRIILACMVGAALSTAGAAYQGVFQNAMASPDILGASSGAAFGAALAILNKAGNIGVTISAFLFSMLTVFLSWFISERGRGKKVLLLILSGIMVSSLFNAATSYLKLVADPNSELQQITYWLMGSLSGAKRKDLLIAGIPMLIGFVPLIICRWQINILTLGDEEARTLGIDADRIRIIVIVSSTLLTAAAVSVSGMIGWVGLVIPHLCRRIVGNNYKYLIPAVIIVGASFLLCVDDVSRTLLQTEIPIGILTAFIGAPFFMVLLTRKGDYV
ncbi:MAG: iron ABC transporter permease [Eubacteriales bacterium]|nr:iron ABC transporter permease [Eubacteriales bacterium]